jgi:hypothetical protein
MKRKTHPEFDDGLWVSSRLDFTDYPCDYQTWRRDVVYHYEKT